MNYGRVFIGAVLVALGVIFGLDALEVLDAGDLIGSWWPAVFLLGAVLMYVANPRRPLAPAVVAVIAATALLVTTGVVTEDVWELVIPVVLILIGVALLMGWTDRRRREEAHEDRVQSFVMFSGSEMVNRSERFRGGNLTALFGGIELDLRDAGLADGANIDVLTAFGGTEIQVPDGWNVVVNGFPLFGGIDNATGKDRLPPDAPRLDVHATVLFGGLEIKH